MELNLIEGINIWLQLFVLALILLTQGTTLFLLAKKRNKNAWLWGIIGLIQFPIPSIVFYFIIVRPDRKKTKVT